MKRLVFLLLLLLFIPLFAFGQSIYTYNNKIFKNNGDILRSSTINEEYQAVYFNNGFSDSKILDSSGNGLDAISRNTGCFIGDGTAYFSITGLLTSDVITALSSDVPTCTINGRLDIANTDTIYGVTITRSGELWAYYPVCERNGACLNDVSGNANHGVMTSGTDANWGIVDYPGTDYLRDYGASKVAYTNNTTFFTIVSPDITALITDSWEIEFNYKLNNLGGTYLLGGDAYISRHSSTVVRLVTSSTTIGFTFAEVPLWGNMKVSYNGTDTFTCNINGTEVNVANSKALGNIYRVGSRGSGYASMNGYIRDLKFTKNGTVLLNIPNLYTGIDSITNTDIITLYGGGEISYSMIPANLDGVTDADGFTIMYPQTGSLAIPGTYFSLPENADLIAACENISLNDYFTDGSANIINADSIGHYDPKVQYYDWVERENLIIIKDNAVISDGIDLKKIKELNYWGTIIADDFNSINSHFSVSEKAYYKSIIESLMHPDFIDNDTTGYYYKTFGPEGLRRDNSGFFLLFFHDDTIAAASNTPFNQSSLLTTPRINVGGDIYNSALFSDHSYNDTDYIVISSVDNFDHTTGNFHTMSMDIGCLKRQLPNLDRYFYLKYAYVGDNLNVDVTDYEINRSNFDYLDLNSVQIYGTYPSYDSTFKGTGLNIGETAITGLSTTSFNTAMTQIDIRKTPIKTAEISSLLSNLKTYFTSNAPVNNLTIKYFDDAATGSIVGYIEDDLSNTEYLDLIDLFTAEGKTFSVTNTAFAADNKHLDPSVLSEACVVFTMDDWYAEAYNNALPVFESKGVSATIYGTIEYIDDATGGGDLYTHERWGRIATWAETIDAYNRGFDMQCHGYVHGSLTEANMILANAAWVSHGIPAPKHIAYPSGAYSDEIIAAIGGYRFTGRTVELGYTGINSIKMKLKCITLDISSRYDPLTHFQQLKSMVDVAYDGGYALILLFHGMPLISNEYDFGADDLADLIDYIQSKEMVIKTIKELYETELE